MHSTQQPIADVYPHAQGVNWDIMVPEITQQAAVPDTPLSKHYQMFFFNAVFVEEPKEGEWFHDIVPTPINSTTVSIPLNGVTTPLLALRDVLSTMGPDAVFYEMFHTALEHAPGAVPYTLSGAGYVEDLVLTPCWCGCGRHNYTKNKALYNKNMKLTNLVWGREVITLQNLSEELMESLSGVRSTKVFGGARISSTGTMLIYIGREQDFIHPFTLAYGRTYEVWELDSTSGVDMIWRQVNKGKDPTKVIQKFLSL